MKALHLIALALTISPGLAAAETARTKDAEPLSKPVAEVTAAVDLGSEFPQMKGFSFMEVLMTIAPGGGMPRHSHAGHPEIVRVLSGTLTEWRNGGPPKTYGPGSTLINASGIEHNWVNSGSTRLVMLAAVVMPKEPRNPVKK